MNQTNKTLLISGASGLVGRSLCEALEHKGHTVKRLSHSGKTDFHWDINAGTIDEDAMKDVDVVVHLAGETVAQRWSRKTKSNILDSRVEGAKLLVRKIMEQDNPPDYISASGINYYGYQCGVGPTEQSVKGDGFLADVWRFRTAAHSPWCARPGLQTILPLPSLSSGFRFHPAASISRLSNRPSGN